MRSPIELSKMIRNKKKAMQDNEEVVDLSGIPEDKTTEDDAEYDEMTIEEGLDHNKPKAHSEDPVSGHQELMADSYQRKMHAEDEHDENSPDPEEYAEGGMIGGRGAIAGGDVPKRTELAKVNGFAEGGEVKTKRKDRLKKIMGY